MALVVFEDKLVTDLAPVSLTRPAFAVRCGGYRLVDLIDWYAGAVQFVVRPYLLNVVSRDFPGKRSSQGVNGSEPHVFLNARLLPSAKAMDRVRQIANSSRRGAVWTGSSLALAVIEGDIPQPNLLDVESIEAYLDDLNLPPQEANLPLVRYPHDLVKFHLDIICENLEHRVENGKYHQLQDGVFLAPDAAIGPHVVMDASEGPIVMEKGASVGPHCYLRGPLHLGRSSQVVSHASLRGVATGERTKLGGEISASIIEDYTNKAHYGFLGHSYLGSWVNLGAGTTTSNLKNTYGEIGVEYGGQRLPTGMQFLGCVVGDYTKSAINTAIFTGKMIGVASMLYGYVTTNVASFLNFARTFAQVSEVPVDVAIVTQRRMHERRALAWRECDQQLLRYLHALTAEERLQMEGQVSNKPLAL